MFLHADVVSCVHAVAVLNAAFCMTSKFFNAVQGWERHIPDCIVDGHECLLLFTTSCCSEFFILLYRFVCCLGVR